LIRTRRGAIDPDTENAGGNFISQGVNLQMAGHVSSGPAIRVVARLIPGRWILCCEMRRRPWSHRTCRDADIISRVTRQPSAARRTSAGLAFGAVIRLTTGPMISSSTGGMCGTAISLPMAWTSKTSPLSE
jgi:hypothetical protein